MSEGRDAFMDRLPQTYELPPELAGHWESIDENEMIPWTKGAITSLQAAIDQLCHASVQSTAVAGAAFRNDFEAFETAYEKLGVAAIEAQNALRHAIAELAAVHQVRKLEAPLGSSGRLDVNLDE